MKKYRLRILGFDDISFGESFEDAWKKVEQNPQDYCNFDLTIEEDRGDEVALWRLWYMASKEDWSHYNTQSSFDEV